MARSVWIAAAALAAAWSLPTADATGLNLLLRSCEKVSYKASKLTFLRHMLPYPGACLCTTEVHAPCFVPEVTGMASHAAIASVEVCIDPSTYRQGQDALIFSGTHTGVTPSSFNSTTGCMMLTGGANATEESWRVAMTCAHYINLATDNGNSPGLITGHRRFTLRLCTNESSPTCVVNTQPVLRVLPNAKPPQVLSSVPVFTFTTALAHPPHGSVPVDEHIACSDPDSSTIGALELRFVTGTFVPTEDVLLCPHHSLLPPNVTCTFNPMSALLRLQGVMTLPQCTAVAAAVRYANTAGGWPCRGRRTLFWIAYDVETEEPSSGYSATTHIDVIGAVGAQCPAITIASAAQVVSAAATPSFVTSFALISPLPSFEPIVEARVRFADGYVPGEDLLAVVSIPAHLSCHFDAATGILRINGSASASEYAFVLRHVVYVSLTPLAPTQSSRTIAFKVGDADCWSTERTTVLMIVDKPECACLPRFALLHPLTLHFRAGTDFLTSELFASSSMVPMIAGSTAASPSPAPRDPASLQLALALATLTSANPAAANCSTTASSLLFAAAVIAFVPAREAPYWPEEDSLVVRLPTHLAAAFAVQFVPGTGMLHLRSRPGVPGVPLALMLEALSHVRYTNVALGDGREGMKHLIAYLLTPGGCRTSSIFVRVMVLPSHMPLGPPPFVPFLECVARGGLDAIGGGEEDDEPATSGALSSLRPSHGALACVAAAVAMASLAATRQVGDADVGHKAGAW